MDTMLTDPTEMRDRGPTEFYYHMLFLYMASHLRKVLRKTSQDRVQLKIMGTMVRAGNEATSLGRVGGMKIGRQKS